MSEMIFKMSNNGQIKIDEIPLMRLSSFRQIEKGMSEAGGVLIGRFIKESKDIVIDRVTVPMLGDRRSRFSFIRGAKNHQRIVDSEWDKSKGTSNYLGEWHTHPEKYPSPSSVDIRDWKRKLKEDIYSSRYLYFVIVGINEIKLWEGDRRTSKIKELSIYKK